MEKYYIYCNFLDYSTLMFYKYHPSKKIQNFIHLPLSHRLLFGCLLNIIVVVKHKKHDNLGWLWLLHIGTVHILHNTTLSIFGRVLACCDTAVLENNLITQSFVTRSALISVTGCS